MLTPLQEVFWIITQGSRVGEISMMNFIKITICLLLVVGMIFLVSCVKNQNKNSSEVVASQDEVLRIPNPIEKSSLDGIMQTLGVKFSVPSDATNIEYSIISKKIGQANFIWNGVECCARIQPSNEVELHDISGFYYKWENEATCQVGYNQAQVKWTKTDSGEIPGICIWFDFAPGITYSVSMKDQSDSEKLCELANLVYIQLQGN